MAAHCSGLCVHGVVLFTAVCVHFGWVICRARIPSMGHPNWPYVTSLQIQKCIFLRVTVNWHQTSRVHNMGIRGSRCTLGVECSEKPQKTMHFWDELVCALFKCRRAAGRSVTFILPADWQVLYADVSTLCRAVEQQVWLGTVYLSAGWSWSDTMASHTHSLGIGARPWLDLV